jgi:DNA-binding NarL/FixJ family response regulator
MIHPVPASIRVLLADDHPVVRHGLAALLGTFEGVEIVGHAADGAGAVREVLLTGPDVVVMDLRMPGMDGVEATKRILRDRPGTAVLVLTMFADDLLVGEALRAGARGYVLKGAEQDEIERALRTVAAGGAVMSPQVASRLLGSLSPRAMDLPALTPREREVLELLASGAPNGRIADALGLAPKTVANHLSALLLKLGVATRGEAIVAARNAGLGGARPW